MSFSYSSDPKNSELDKYRFQIGDTDPASYMLEDAEITYILTTYDTESARMMYLFEHMVNTMSRWATKKKLGPQVEEYKDRLHFFTKRYEYYRAQNNIATAPTMATPHDDIFFIGIHDNQRVAWPEVEGTADV